MHKDTQRAFHDSLDITDEALDPFIPQLLDGLTVLGSMPEYALELITRHVAQEFAHVTDLGCGKGAVLIALARVLPIQGTGIDLVPEFIEEAGSLAEEHLVSGRLSFIVGDIRQAVHQIRDQDIVIYGDDAGILGDMTQTVRVLSECIHDAGYLVLEVMCTAGSQTRAEDVPTWEEILHQIAAAGSRVVDVVFWEKSKVQ